MKEIDYLAPSSLGEAYAALQNGKTSAFLAGGTDIIVQLREGRKEVDQLIDVKHIPELMSYAWTNDGGLEIGASVPFAEIYEDDEIVRPPALRHRLRDARGRHPDPEPRLLRREHRQLRSRRRYGAGAHRARRHAHHRLGRGHA